MSALRFTKAERGVIRSALDQLLELVPGGTKAELKAIESVLAKLDKSEVTPAKSGGMGVAAAIKEFQGVLGRRLVLPPGKLTAGWCAQMANRLAALGMTPELCKTAALQAGLEWNGPIKAESIIRQADRLIHNTGTDGASAGTAPHVTMLDDEDL